MLRFNFLASETKYPPGPGFALPPSRLNSFRRNPTGFLSELARTYGDIVHFRMGRRHFFLLSHPDLIRQVLVDDQEKFQKGNALQKMRSVLGDGLLTSEGERHRGNRKRIQPAFHHGRITHYADSMVALAEEVAADWQTGQIIDVAEAMNRLTLLIAGRTLFSTDLTQEAGTIAAALDSLFFLSDPLLMVFSEWMEWLPTSTARRFRDARQRLVGIVESTIAEHRRQLQGGTPQDDLQDDLLDMLLQGYGALETRCYDQEIVDHVLTLLLAGHETTANALAWSWWLLSQHPRVEEKLHRELDGQLAGGRLPDAADVQTLTYTRHVLSESMRLYPPAWIIGREALVDCDVAGYRIPAGASILMSQWVVHRDARYYSQPARFWPERWAVEDRKSRPRFAYFPFGAGPRVCIGAQFAWTEGVLLMATLARAWRFTAETNRSVTIDPRVTLRPSNGLTLRVQRRRG